MMSLDAETDRAITAPSMLIPRTFTPEFTPMTPLVDR